MKPSSSSRGFSLVEIAVALFILTLVLSAVLTPIQARVLNRQIHDNEKILAQIRDALLGFAAANGYLPCPDITSGGGGTPNDGQEDVSSGSCVTSAGNLPWSTLGVGATDPWGNRFRYVVLPAFSSRSPTTLTLTTPATIKICPYAACAEADLLVPPVIDASTANNANLRAALVVISHGPNGYGAMNSLSGNFNLAPTSADELANLGTTDFVSRTFAGQGAASGEFDDAVIWIAKPTLFASMVKAGRLP